GEASATFLPPGTYNIGSPVLVNIEGRDLHFVGVGALLQYTGNGGYMFNRTAGSEDTNVTFEHIYFRHMSAWDTVSGVFNFAGLRRFYIHDCDFESRRCIRTYYDANAAGWGIHQTSIQ